MTDEQRSGLYGEVVKLDIYRLQPVSFTPDVVIDLGANVGIFSNYARSLWADAVIISVEPDHNNIQEWEEKPGIIIQAAIGKGPVHRFEGANNGAMEVYATAGPGYTQGYLDQEINRTNLKAMMLTDLKKYIRSRDTVLCKIDIEGNETVIFNDPASVKMLSTFEYICGELHSYGYGGDAVIQVRRITDAALEELKATHHVYRNHIHFYARMKEL